MLVKLSTEMAELLINEVEDASSLISEQWLSGEEGMKLEVSDIGELQLLINDEILYRGLDKQDTVNALGKRLYELYDEILYQKNSIKEQ